MPTDWPESALLSRIRELLVRRRVENREIGIHDRDNIFDTKLLGLLGEELCCGRFGAARSERVNNDDWDVTLPEGRNVQVKTRAIYRHSADGIHIDFKRLAFDYLYLVLVDDQMHLLGDGLISRERLAQFVVHEKSGKLRLRDVRRRHPEYFAASWTSTGAEIDSRAPQPQLIDVDKLPEHLRKLVPAALVKTK